MVVMGPLPFFYDLRSRFFHAPVNKQLTLCYCLFDVKNKRFFEVTTVAYISNALAFRASDQELV